MGLSAEELHSLPIPDIVLASKKDVYDPKNVIFLFVSKTSYTKTYASAFSIYTKSAF